MTRKIRADLVGVVHVPGQIGVTLKAGDEVPEGVDLGDHLFDQPATEPAEPATEPARPVRSRKTN